MSNTPIQKQSSVNTNIHNLKLDLKEKIVDEKEEKSPKLGNSVFKEIETITVLSPRSNELTSPRGEINQSKRLYLKEMEIVKKEIESPEEIYTKVYNDILKNRDLLNPKMIKLNIDNECCLTIVPEEAPKREDNENVSDLRVKVLLKKKPYYLGYPPKDVEVKHNEKKIITISLNPDDLNKKITEKYSNLSVAFTSADLKNLFFAHYLNYMNDFTEGKLSGLMNFEGNLLKGFEKYIQLSVDDLSKEEIIEVLEEKEKIVLDKDFVLKELICGNLENLFISGNGGDLSKWEENYKQFLKSVKFKDLEMLVCIMRLGGLSMTDKKSSSVSIKDFLFYMILPETEKDNKLHIKKHHLELCLYFAERNLLQNIISDKEGFEVFIKHATEKDIKKIIVKVKGEESRFVEPSSIESKGRTDSGIDFVRVYGELLQKLKSKYEVKRKSFSVESPNLDKNNVLSLEEKKRPKSVSKIKNEASLEEEIKFVEEEKKEDLESKESKKSSESKKSGTSFKDLFGNLSFRIKRKSNEGGNEKKE